MKTLKVQIFENGKRIDKAIYHGYTLTECIKKLMHDYMKKGVCNVWND